MALVPALLQPAQPAGPLAGATLLHRARHRRDGRRARRRARAAAGLRSRSCDERGRERPRDLPAPGAHAARARAASQLERVRHPGATSRPEIARDADGQPARRRGRCYLAVRRVEVGRRRDQRADARRRAGVVRIHGDDTADRGGRPRSRSAPTRSSSAGRSRAHPRTAASATCCASTSRRSGSSASSSPRAAYGVGDLGRRRPHAGGAASGRRFSRDHRRAASRAPTCEPLAARLAGRRARRRPRCRASATT